MKGEIYTPDESGTAISEAERTARLLTRAADRLDELAGAATQPWRSRPAGDHEWPGYVIEVDSPVQTTVAREVDGDDAAWIAAMSPAVAAPLVAWLRLLADEVRNPMGIFDGESIQKVISPSAGQVEAAVEFARLVLGRPLEAVGPESAGDGSAGSASVRPLEAPVAVQRPENDHG